MDANLFDLAQDLVQLAPHSLPKFAQLLDEQMSDEQKNTVRNRPPLGMYPPVPRAAPSIPVLSAMPAQRNARSGPILRFVSGPQSPVVQGLPDHNQGAQAILAAAQVMPAHQMKATLLAIAEHRLHEVKMIFYIVCSFFAFCLFLFFAGIILLFAGSTIAGEILTALGTVLSSIGGVLISMHQNTHKHLDDIIEKIQQI